MYVRPIALRTLGFISAQVVDSYRTKLRGGLPGADGDDVARKRVEEFANKFRPSGFLVRLCLKSTTSVVEGTV